VQVQLPPGHSPSSSHHCRKAQDQSGDARGGTMPQVRARRSEPTRPASRSASSPPTQRAPDKWSESRQQCGRFLRRAERARHARRAVGGGGWTGSPPRPAAAGGTRSRGEARRGVVWTRDWRRGEDEGGSRGEGWDGE
jgi:hypothetical protein